METFLKGFAAGFIIAVPLGPVSILCFRRVLTGNRLVGIVTVLGAATADTFYGLVAALGFTAVARVLLSHRAPLRIAGGLFLVYLGFRMLHAHFTGNPGADANNRKPSALFLSTALLMLANPSIMVSFAAVFAAVDLAVRWTGAVDAVSLGLGIFLGSASWWLVYKLASAGLGERLKRDGLHIINVAAGSLISALGVWQLVALALGR